MTDVTLAELRQLELPRDQVPHGIRQAAFDALLTVGSGLGLKPFPSLKFLPRSAGHRLGVRGIVCPEAPAIIWLVVQESAADVVETISHEAKHVEQLARWGAYMGEDGSCFSMPEREKVADAYGKSVRARFETGRPLVDPPKRPVPAPAPARRTAPPPRSPAPAARPTATTVRHYHAPSEAETAMLERKRRIHTTGGLKWISCEACEQAVLIGSTHHCSAARAAAKRYGW